MASARILIVEDDLSVAHCIATVLEKSGYVVPSIIQSAQEAVQAATETGPDLVLMDIMINGVADGIDAATQIGTRLDIPVVYLTGLADAQTLERARDSDAFGYVLKPFTPGELRAAIEVALHTHEMSKKLKASEALYRAVVEDQTEFICRFQSDGTLTFVNQACCRYFGKTREELIGRSFLSLIPEDYQRRVVRSIASLSAENPVVTYKRQILGPDGEIRWLRWTNRAIFDELGGLVEFQGVGRDITDRVCAEETLRESEETARALLNAPADLAMLMGTCEPTTDRGID
jgi:two-component system NtrC family sensor kinase